LILTFGGTDIAENQKIAACGSSYRGAKLTGKDGGGNRSDLLAGDGRDTAIPVGAGLLAKAVCQATLMLDVMASSRASPLPQD